MKQSHSARKQSDAKLLDQHMVVFFSFFFKLNLYCHAIIFSTCRFVAIIFTTFSTLNIQRIPIIATPKGPHQGYNDEPIVDIYWLQQSLLPEMCVNVECCLDLSEARPHGGRTTTPLPSAVTKLIHSIIVSCLCSLSLPRWPIICIMAFTVHSGNFVGILR